MEVGKSGGDPMTLVLRLLFCLFERYGSCKETEIPIAQAPSPYVFSVDLTSFMDPQRYEHACREKDLVSTSMPVRLLRSCVRRGPVES